jgi:hypothetical protein
MKRTILLAALLVLALCLVVHADERRNQYPTQTAVQPYGRFWYTEQAVNNADSAIVWFPSGAGGFTAEYRGWKFTDADGVTLYTDQDIEIMLFSDLEGVYAEYQELNAGDWFPWPDVDADSLSARNTSGATANLKIWVWKR